MESLLSLIRITRRRRNILLACCALGSGGYLAYRVCTSSSVTRKRRQFYRFFHSLLLLLETAAQGSDCAGVLWNDLHTFVLSRDDEVPQSLKQFFKIGQTQEFQQSVRLLCMSVTEGVVSSLSERGSDSQDGSDYGSALFEEFSSRKKFVRKTVGQKDNTDRYHSWKDRRWRSSGDIDCTQCMDTPDGEDYNKLNKFVRSESASRIDGQEFGRYSTLKATRNYYGEKSSTAAAPMGETSADNGKGKNRFQRERRGNAEVKTEGIPERLIGKIFGQAGRGFASAVVASAARSIVLSVFEGYLLKNQNSNLKDFKVWNLEDWDAQAVRDVPQNGEQKDGFFGDTIEHKMPSHGNLQDGILDFLCSSRGKALVADCIECFIGTAVATYLEKTRDDHFYEEMLLTVAKPAHREHVKELLTSVCNGAVETLIRTSHDVLVAGAAGPRESEVESFKREEENSRDGDRPVFFLRKSTSLKDLRHLELEDLGECGRSEGANEQCTPGSSPRHTPGDLVAGSLSASGLGCRRIAFDHSPQSEKKGLENDISSEEALVLPPSSYQEINDRALSGPPISTAASQGWIDGVSRTLAVPSNRALMLDVAGTVSAEAVRSAIEVVFSKVTLKLLGDRKEKAATPGDGHSSSKTFRVISRTGELAQRTAAKAMIAVTMCLAICLHTLVGPSPVPLHSQQ